MFKYCLSDNTHRAESSEVSDDITGEIEDITTS